jgi:hypothetical protein
MSQNARDHLCHLVQSATANCLCIFIDVSDYHDCCCRCCELLVKYHIRSICFFELLPRDAREVGYEPIEYAKVDVVAIKDISAVAFGDRRHHALCVFNACARVCSSRGARRCVNVCFGVCIFRITRACRTARVRLERTTRS